MAEWYIAISGKTIGPFTEEIVLFLIAQGRVRADDYIFGPGIAEWSRIDETSPFSAALPATAAVPKPPKGARPAPPPPAPGAVDAAPKVAAKSGKAKPAPVKVEDTPTMPAKRQWRVPIDAKVLIDGSGPYPVGDISEGGLAITLTPNDAAREINVGDEVKLKIESPSFSKTLDMMAVVVRRETEGERSIGVEFIRANPAYRRAIAAYVSARMGEE